MKTTLQAMMTIMTNHANNKIDLKLKAGILGGGQLAWLLGLSAKKYGISTRVWDVEPGASGFRSASEIHCASWDAERNLAVFCKGLDFCTLEWESVPQGLLMAIESSGLNVFPSSRAVKQASSRILERGLFASLGFDLSPWMAVSSPESLTQKSWDDFWNLGDFKKVYLKHDRGGYDGKGQMVVDRHADLEDVKNFFRLGDSRGIIEAGVDLSFEASVIGARARSGKVSVLGFFENHHENGVLRTTKILSHTDKRIDASQLKSMISDLLTKTNYVGVAALELFVDKSGNVFANEWAPRVHNSGHITLDTHKESQFDWHWKAISDLEMAECDPIKNGVMVNVLAEDLGDGSLLSRASLLDAKDPFPFLSKHLSKAEIGKIKKVIPYDYGKSQLKPGRKMGHLNVLF